ncbi:MAG TPA: hypothetical protein VKO16_14540, partial [Polyangia bacterium]|nr:hypothetical protein [Polyangia bacterium]
LADGHDRPEDANRHRSRHARATTEAGLGDQGTLVDGLEQSATHFLARARRQQGDIEIVGARLTEILSLVQDPLRGATSRVEATPHRQAQGIAPADHSLR